MAGESETVGMLFETVWASRHDEEALDHLYILLREKWQEYRSEKILGLCFRAFIERDEAEKARLEKEIQDRGLGEDYEFASGIWEEDGIRDLISDV